MLPDSQFDRLDADPHGLSQHRLTRSQRRRRSGVQPESSNVTRLAIVAGNDPVFRKAATKKLEDLRLQFPVNDNPFSRLIVERILSTWVQLSFAEGKMAEVGSVDRKAIKFYSRLNQKAQR